MRDADADEFAQSAFAAGTMLRTDRGDVAVEMLKPGDMLSVASGGHRPIRAIRGGRAVDGRGVLIPKNAIGDGKPRQDLIVTADQHVCLKIVSEVLVPVGLLIYKSTLVDVDAAEQTFWQIELEDDDILHVDGLEMPSSVRADAHLPERIEDRRLIEMIRAILMGRAAALGWSLNGAPALDLHVLVDGERVEPESNGAVYRFILPCTASEVWLVSECSVPKEIGVNADSRLLGACLAAIRIDDGLLVNRDVPLDAPGLAEGFHEAESECRWTDGCAKLPPVFWSDCQGVFFLTLRLALPALPRYCRPTLQP